MEINFNTIYYIIKAYMNMLSLLERGPLMISSIYFNKMKFPNLYSYMGCNYHSSVTLTWVVGLLDVLYY